MREKKIGCLERLEGVLQQVNPHFHFEGIPIYDGSLYIGGQKPRTELLTMLYDAVSGTLADQSLREIILRDENLVVAKVLARVWEAAWPNMIGRQLLGPQNVVSQDTATLKVIKEPGPVLAEFIGSVGELPEITGEYGYEDLSPVKSGIRSQISKDMIEDAEWDIVERQLARCGKAMANLETKTIVEAMISDAGNSVAAATAGTLAYSDVVACLNLIQADDYNPDTMALHPNQFADLLTDTAIRKALDWGGPAVAPTGRIAQLLGMKLFVSTRVTDTNVLLIDSGEAGVLFIRRDVTPEDYDDPIRDLEGLAFTARWKYKTLAADAIGKITGA
ncbi:MAG: hypothetical protein ACE5GD_08195 [Candidatus Geothermarchaeales archaeon]